MPVPFIPITSKEYNSPLFTSRHVLNGGIIVIALFLITTGILKVISPTGVINTSRELFPEAGHVFHFTVGSLLPVLELGLGLMLLLKWKFKWIITGTTFLFGLFLLISMYGQIIGVESDCGCFGGIITSSFGWGMLGRNGILLLGSTLIWYITFNKRGNHERKI